jgi:hypothetical protein
MVGYVARMQEIVNLCINWWIHFKGNVPIGNMAVYRRIISKLIFVKYRAKLRAGLIYFVIRNLINTIIIPQIS